MTRHKIDAQLAGLGIDVATLDPDVLAALRAASPEPVEQLTRDDLGRMTPEQIEAARLDGQLDHLLGKGAS